MKKVKMTVWELCKDIKTRAICYVEIRRSMVGAVKEKFYFSEVITSPFTGCILLRKGDSFVQIMGMQSITLCEGYYRIVCGSGDEEEVVRIVFNPQLEEEEKEDFILTGRYA